MDRVVGLAAEGERLQGVFREHRGEGQDVALLEMADAANPFSGIREAWVDTAEAIERGDAGAAGESFGVSYTATAAVVVAVAAPFASGTGITAIDSAVAATSTVESGAAAGVADQSVASSASTLSGTRPPNITGRRWRTGDPHWATVGGREPSPHTVRYRYWRNRWAQSIGSGEFSEADLARMRRGRPPHDPHTGRPIELEHMVPQRTGDPLRHRDLLEVTRLEHSFFDRCRTAQDVSGRSFSTSRATDTR
jgi:hypothetical protein